MSEIQKIEMEDEPYFNTQYGAYYYPPIIPNLNLSKETDLYSYQCFIGEKRISNLKAGESVITLSADRSEAHWFSWKHFKSKAGQKSVSSFLSKHFAVILSGYQCGDKTASLTERVNLPYVNGCASRQIFAPERVGDPTFQQLTIPPYTSEQVHHIHPTSRVVYVLDGRGYSLVGQSGSSVETPLTKGMVCVLDPMCPHHFRTEDEYLTVLPVHIFSSGPANMDNNHPMFNGTKEV
ncbi:MAG: hypothetical protein CBC83_00130 [Flavobacteriales bacterium TMED123]|nr:MAG: hypothetical protein CBC83_00130 [Flavobacteriales bacterium TMED123]|tara:strand:+ start:1647 stop:2354 length:708 start_codon:yes stop_codon:yes gene_type:complete